MLFELEKKNKRTAKSKKIKKISKVTRKTKKKTKIKLIVNFDENDPREVLFPKDKNINLKDLLISNISEYSVDKPLDAEYICKIIKMHLSKKNIIITDATSNVGGSVIAFAKNFNKVNAVELEKIHCKALENNLKIYKLSDNVKIYCQNYLDIMDKLHQDIIYFDPPWGGKDYKKEYLMDLFLGNTNIIKLINKVKTKTKLIVFKVPKNYNFGKFFLEINYDKITIYKINRTKNKVSYYIIVLEV